MYFHDGWIFTATHVHLIDFVFKNLMKLTRFAINFYYILRARKRRKVITSRSIFPGVIRVSRITYMKLTRFVRHSCFYFVTRLSKRELERVVQKARGRR